MTDTYQPSPIGPAQPVAVPSGPPAHPITPTPSPSSPYAPSFDPNKAISTAIIHTESGGKNVTSPVGAKGPGQIMPATFRQYARPGENINNPADNLAVHQRIIDDYMHRYNGDMARVAVAYFSGPGNVAPPGSATPWIRNSSDGNMTVSQYVASTAGRAGAGGGGTSTAAPAASAVPVSTPANIGLALAALNQPSSSGRSTMDNLSSMVPQSGGDSGGAQPANQGLQQQFAAAPGNARSQQIAQQAQPMMAALQKQAMQPLTGVQQPPQGMIYMGGQAIPMPGRVPTPGTTLNSMGG